MAFKDDKTMTSSIDYSLIWSAKAEQAGQNDPFKFDGVTIDQWIAEARVRRAHLLAGTFAALGTKVARGLRAFIAAQKRRSAVAQLMAMDERMLRDIGLSRSEVPLVVCGLATGEAPHVFANAEVSGHGNDDHHADSRSHAA
jgi:uncharacterized protein YjiS (DUF1127 family)